MKIQKFIILILLIQLFLIYGCSTGFMKNEEITKFDNAKSEKHTFIYYKKVYSLNNQLELTEQNHFLLKVGKNINSAPDLFYVFDTSIRELTDFGARVIKTDGSVELFSEGELQTINLTSKERVSDSYVKIIPGFQQLSCGDIVEVYYSHRYRLPQLGIEFYMNDLKYPVENFTLVVQTPDKLDLSYKDVNDFPAPVVSQKENIKNYTFSINDYQRNTQSSIMGKKNYEPGILIAVPEDSDMNYSWKEFGDWYLDLIGSKISWNSKIKSLAGEITKSLISPKEKMDAIFNYCQTNIRYEQVYFEKGEFIPNDCGTILERKFGDCKDYATLIYAMGKSIGLNPHLALCHRGRGSEFYKDITVSQFNHMIVYYSANGKDYWYDGTNRIGVPGLTSSDLINQEALVLIKGLSRLEKIGNDDSNLLELSGEMKPVNKDLKGHLNIDLYEQYAVDFFYMNQHLNKNKMVEFISEWIKHNLNESILISDLYWSEENRKFHIAIDCTIPNCILVINNYDMISVNRVFPDIFPSMEIKEDDIFYFPFYDKVSVNVLLDGLREEYAPSDYDLKYNFSISPGPFSESEKPVFLNHYKDISKKLSSWIKLKRVE